MCCAWKSLILLSVLALQACSTTMLTAPCHEPSVSNRGVPFVYMVVLPYVYRGKNGPSESHLAAARTLNELAGLEAVRMAAETTDMHVTLLEDKGKGCSIERVYSAFADSGSALQRKLLSSVVFYWGEVFEQGDRIVVQSHVRVFWKDERDKLIHIDVTPPKSSTAFRFTGYVPYATISFPPRRLPVGNEPGGAASLKALLQAREWPGNDAAPVPLPSRFRITQHKNSWVELRDLNSTRTVWVSVSGPGNAAKTILPELSFAHALAAYVNYRGIPDAAIARDSVRWLEVFRKAYADERDPLLRRPIAVADVIEGVLELARQDGDAQSHQRRAGELLDRAAQSLPANSAVLNLSAISSIGRCCETKEDALRIQRRLELARRLDAGNAEIARNLLSWYRLLETKDAGVWPYSPDEVRKRSGALAEALQ